jgi:hypothetical protein
MPYAISNPADEKCLTAMTPRMLVGTAPIANGSASFGSILPSRQNPIDALAVLANTSTSDVPATSAGGTPNARRSTGITRNPPPSPTSEPNTLAAAPIRNSASALSAVTPW